jgi:hypothetical protein
LFLLTSALRASRAGATAADPKPERAHRRREHHHAARSAAASLRHSDIEMDQQLTLGDIVIYSSNAGLLTNVADFYNATLMNKTGVAIDWSNIAGTNFLCR